MTTQMEPRFLHPVLRSRSPVWAGGTAFLHRPTIRSCFQVTSLCSTPPSIPAVYLLLHAFETQEILNERACRRFLPHTEHHQSLDLSICCGRCQGLLHQRCDS